MVASFVQMFSLHCSLFLFMPCLQLYSEPTLQLRAPVSQHLLLSIAMRRKRKGRRKSRHQSRGIRGFSGCYFKMLSHCLPPAPAGPLILENRVIWNHWRENRYGIEISLSLYCFKLPLPGLLGAHLFCGNRLCLSCYPLGKSSWNLLQVWKAKHSPHVMKTVSASFLIFPEFPWIHGHVSQHPHL